METDSYYQVLTLFILLIFSALFSGSEVAMFSLDRKKLKDLKKDSIITGYISSLVENQRRLLVTILLGNTLVNVGASIVAVTLALNFASAYNISVDLILLIQIVALTVLVLLFGEVIPKVWATRYPLQFAKLVSVPLYWISIIVYPVSKILTDVIRLLISRLRYNKMKTALMTSEIPDLADIGVEKGTIEEDEQELIHGLVAFKTVSAREVMTPRIDIAAISIDDNFDELVNTITTSGHSRLPVYEENMDNIIGILYAKDLLPYVGNRELQAKLVMKKLIRSALFIPESKLINELMHEFQEKNVHIGIVVDEYGGTAGLITLEDILEEIVGEIRDEHDIEETPITQAGENIYLVLGKTGIEELNDYFEYDFSSENDDYDTVGGFIFNLAGSIPKKGYTTTYGEYKFTVIEVVNNRIKKVQVEKAG